MYMGSNEHDYIEHDESHVNIRPQYVENRGVDDYTDTGLRDALEISLSAYINGEKTTARAITSDIPENGEIVFAGNHVEANRIQLVVSGTAGETQITSIHNAFIKKQKPGSRTERTMTERTMQATLVGNRVIHATRGGNVLTNRVNNDYANTGTYTGITGPDGRALSAGQADTLVTIANPAMTDHTWIMWSKTAAPGPLTGLNLTEYSSSGDWYLLYSQGVGPVAANITMAIGQTFFDIRVHNSQITGIAALLGYIYRDTVNNGGKALIPGF